MSLSALFNRNAPPPIPPLTDPGRGEFDCIADHYDFLMRAVPYRRWVDYVEAILERRLHRPGRVLDLCCGTGKVGAEMLRRGYDVFGADLSEPMVRRCATQLPPLPATVQDAAQLGLRPASFDLVVSLYDSLNYILQPPRLASCFDGVFSSLAPGGLFIFDLNTPRALSTGLFTQNNLRSNELLLYSWQAHWDPARRLCRVDMWFNWRGDGQDHIFEETHWQYAYRKEDVLEMLNTSGFRSITPFHAYTFRPPPRTSDRIYYVARKE